MKTSQLCAQFENRLTADAAQYDLFCTTCLKYAPDL